MLDVHDIRLDFLETGQFETPRNDLHRKVVPYLIVAQAYAGHYEVQAGAEKAVLATGQCFLTPPGVQLAIRHHSDRQSGCMRARWAHLKVTVLGSLDLCDLIQLPLAAPAATSARLGSLIQSLLETAGEPLPKALRQARIGYQIVEELLTIAPPTERLGLLRGDARQLLPALQLIRDRLADPPSMDDLADHVHMSRSRFYALFQEALGISPKQYLDQQRIGAAAELLREPGACSVQEAAARLGYSNPFHFSRVFSRVLGLSPKHYQQSQPDRMH